MDVMKEQLRGRSARRSCRTMGQRLGLCRGGRRRTHGPPAPLCFHGRAVMRVVEVDERGIEYIQCISRS